jgi:hypothetical protein
VATSRLLSPRFCRVLSLALLMLSAVSARAAAPARYHNGRWDFCIVRPAGWSLYEGFNKAGAEFSPSAHRPTLAVINVGALPNGPERVDSDEPMTLRQIVDEGIQDPWDLAYRPARSVRLLHRTNIKFASLPAIWTKATLTTQDGDQEWLETIDFLHDGLMYQVRFQCRLRDRGRYEPIFRQVASSFQLKCGRGTSL